RVEGPYVSEFYQREALGQTSVVTIAQRIRDPEGNTVGYLGAQYAITDLKVWLASVRLADAGRLTLFDQNGNQAITDDSPEDEDLRHHPTIQRILGQPAGSLQVNQLGGFNGSLLSHFPIPELGWTVVAYQPNDVVYAPMQRLLRMILLFFVFALAALGFLGWLWFRVLHAYAEDMRRTNLELQNFCYSIAHDLRAPLRAMRGFSIILQQDYSDRLDKEGLEYANRIAHASQRMDRLINDLLDYGRIAHRSLQFERVNLDHCMRQAIGDLWGEIERRGAEVKIQENLGTVSADAAMLQVVFVHLLGNAIKYVERGVTPKVDVSSEERNGCVRIWVKDNGIGIPPGHFERIFGIFQRLHADDSYSGTGVGLAIVKKATERMGGTVGLESDGIVGCSFWVELPKN
ncbi:MAG: ATP-binding protein, partial [Limisphaerales bacterium]